MKQQGQVFELKTRSHGGEAVWAYRYRIAGRDSRRLQRGGFKSERAAREALERALARLRREQGLVEAPRLRELVDRYLAHEHQRRASLRGHTSAPAGSWPSRQLGTDRCQSRKTGHRQPPTPLHREKAIRVMGRTRSARRRTWTALRAARALRCRDRAAAR